MKRFKLFIATLCIVAITPVFAFAQLKIEGGWTIDLKRSDLGGMKADVALPGEINVTQNGDSIFVVRKFGDNIVSEKLLLDGEFIESLPNENTLKRSRVRRSADKKSVEFLWHYEINGKEYEYRRMETWKLSTDLNELTISRITTLPDKIDSAKGVYIREKQIE